MTTFDAHIDMPWKSGCAGASRPGARYGVSARRLGVDALGDLSFVGTQMRGRSVRLDTADRVPAFMRYSPPGPAFLCEIEALLAVTGIKSTMLGEDAVGNPFFCGEDALGELPEDQDSRPDPRLDDG